MTSALDSVLRKYEKSPLSSDYGFLFSVNDATGRTLYNKGNGPSLFPSDRQLDEDSFIWMASGTKIITAVAVMIAVEKGLVSLDEPVERHIPKLGEVEVLCGFEKESGVERPILRKAKGKLTLRNLLSHSSGFGYKAFGPDLIKWAKLDRGMSKKEVISSDFAGDLDYYYHPLVFEPGEDYRYGPGVDWAGRVVETVTGQSMEVFCKEHIWNSIGAYDTTFFPARRPDLLARRARMSNSKRPATSSGWDPYPLTPKECSPGIGVWSTPKDFNKILSMLLRGGGSVLSYESVLEITRPQVQSPEPFMRHLHEWDGGILGGIFPKDLPLSTGLTTCITLEDCPGRRAKGSFSWITYTNTHWWVDPVTGISAALYMQVTPLGHPEVPKLLDQLERALYKDLEVQRDMGVNLQIAKL